MDRKWWTLIAVCVATFMLLVDVTIVNVALPDIQTDLGASFSSLQWVIDAYALLLAALLLTTGSLADLLGRRLIFVLGLVVFSLGSLACGLAPTPLFLDLARGAQGVGGAAMFSTALALIAAAFHGHDRGVAFGVWGAITGLAVAFGPVAGGGIIALLSWRWVFLVNVPIGVIAIVVALLRVQESRDPDATRPDYVGLVTFSGGLGALVYGLIESEQQGWGSTVVVACLAGSVVLLTAFLVSQRLQARAMFDLSLFRLPTFVGGSIAAFALSAGLFALLTYLTLYLQGPLRLSALQTGVRLLFLSGGTLVTATIAGRLSTHVPIRLLIGPGLALVGVGLLLMRGLDARSEWTHLIPGFIVAGLGSGLINPPLASTAVGVVEPARAGMASGINSTFRQVGIATGIAALGAVFAHRVRTDVLDGLHGVPGLPPGDAGRLADAVSRGSGVRSVLAGAPDGLREPLSTAIGTGFTGGLNQVFLIGAVLVLVSALLTLVLIRSRDFDAAARGPARVRRGSVPGPAVAAEEGAPTEDERSAADETDAAGGPVAAGGVTAAGPPGAAPAGSAANAERERLREELRRCASEVEAAQSAAGETRRRLDELIAELDGLDAASQASPGDSATAASGVATRNVKDSSR